LRRVLSAEFLREYYWERKLSPAEIGRMVGRSAQTVRRHVKALFEHPRTKSEAQKIATRKGSATSPMLGRSHAPEARAKMAAAAAAYWAGLGEQGRAAHAEAARKRLLGRTPESRAAMRAGAVAGCRRAVREGSNAELFLRDGLAGRGERVLLKGAFGDLTLPDRKAAVFVDGPALFVPIFGAGKLAATQRLAAAARSRALANGFHVVRIRVPGGRLSRLRLDRLLTLLVNQLELLTSHPTPAEHEVAECPTPQSPSP
jgi:hypothetical protein